MKIEKSIYEGYLWYSDKHMPEVLKNEEIEILLTDGENPFIIEGQLYDAQKMISYSIKFVDGEYICKTYYNVNKDVANDEDIMLKMFHSNRMEGKKLQFLQYWKEKEDELCEGMKVLQPAELVFVGFVKE